MREIIAQGLCDEGGFRVLSRKGPLWILGEQRAGNSAMDFFYIADVHDADDSMVPDIFKYIKERKIAEDPDIRLNLMIITDVRIPEKIEGDDAAYDFLWIVNTKDKCLKLITSESLKSSNYLFLRNNKLNLLKTLILNIIVTHDITGKEKAWQIFY